MFNFANSYFTDEAKRIILEAFGVCSTTNQIVSSEDVYRQIKIANHLQDDHYKFSAINTMTVSCFLAEKVCSGKLLEWSVMFSEEKQCLVFIRTQILID